MSGARRRLEGSKVAGKVGMMALPVGVEGQKSSGCLGPMYLGVSKYTAKPELAADLCRYLVGPEVQKMRAIEAPTIQPQIESLYSDKEVLTKLPFLADGQIRLRRQCQHALRLYRIDYNRVSQAFYRAVHEMLSPAGRTWRKDLADLAARLETLKEGR